MSEDNGSVVTEFVIVGFPGLQPKYYGLVAAIMFLVYVCTLLGNAIFFIVFVKDHSLHKPMYIIILNLVVLDVLFSTTTLPKIIARYWFQAGTISFTGCFVQMFFVHYFATVVSVILLIMALDRYVAICYPLRYPMIMTNSNVWTLCATAWLISQTGPLTIVIRAYPLPYCASNKIVQCYCDHYSITVLACIDRTDYSIPGLILAMLDLLGTLALIIFSYASIIVAVFQITSTEGRLKMLSTCSAQLIIIALYFVPRCAVYLATTLGVKFSRDLHIVIIMLYSLLPPMINPIIYCFRTTEVKQVLQKKIWGQRVHAQRPNISTLCN